MMLEESWVANETAVTARTAYPWPKGMTHGAGVVIGFCEDPQVLIRREDGSTFWWRADLCTKDESR